MQPRCGALVGAVGIDPCEGRGAVTRPSGRASFLRPAVAARRALVRGRQRRWAKSSRCAARLRVRSRIPVRSRDLFQAVLIWPPSRRSRSAYGLSRSVRNTGGGLAISAHHTAEPARSRNDAGGCRCTSGTRRLGAATFAKPKSHWRRKTAQTSKEKKLRRRICPRRSRPWLRLEP